MLRGDPWRTTWNEVENTQEFLIWKQASFSVPKYKKHRQKILHSQRPVLRSKLKKCLVFCGQDEKDRRVIIDIIQSVETDALMAIVAFVDKLMVR